MIYNELPTTIMNVIQYQYEQQTKFAILFILLMLSLIYIYIIVPNMKETDHFISAIFRVIIYISSYTYLLFALPLFLFLMNPLYNYETMIIILLRLYMVVFTGISVWLFVTFSINLPFAILKIGKYNLDMFKKNKVFQYFTRNIK